jgi:hypothetical protein
VSSDDTPRSDSAALIEAWRARGDDRFDPVRFHFVEALVRRTADHRGGARRVLDAKVERVLSSYSEDLARAGCAPAAEDPPATQAGAATPGPLAGLVDHIARHAPFSPTVPSAPELKTLSLFRSTWTRLSADRRLTQSLAKVPENAGPLNSHHLVHRSLSLMRELSPEYLNRFVSYVDTLLWIDQAKSGGPPATAPRLEKQKKTARTRSG